MEKDEATGTTGDAMKAILNQVLVAYAHRGQAGRCL